MSGNSSLTQVGKRTKGCKTCRLRRIKCDLGRPECQRCFTTGRRCQGYDRDLKISVTTSVSWPQKHLRQSTKTSKEPQGAPEPSATLMPPNRSQRNPNIHASIFTQPDSHTLNCELFAELFLKSFMPNQMGQSFAANLSCGWLTVLPILFHGQHDLLSKSLLVLYTGFVGRTGQNAELSHLSMSLYAETLQTLREFGLSSFNPNYHDLDSRLAVTMILARCELLAIEGKSGGFMTHVRGGLQLLKQYGEYLPPTALSKMVVTKLRCYGVSKYESLNLFRQFWSNSADFEFKFYDAVRRRKSYFMSEPPFNNLYLAQKGDPDYYFQRAYESVIILPNLMEWADKLDASKYLTENDTRQGQKLAQKLLRSALKMYKNFNDWYLEMSEEIKPPIQVESCLESDCPSTKHFLYTKKEDSYVWILYWAKALYVNQVIKQLQSHFASCSQRLGSNLELPKALAELGKDDSEMDEYAENIQSSLTPNIGLSTMDAMESMVPVFALHWYWEQRGHVTKSRWCLEALTAIQNKGVFLDIQVKDQPHQVPSVQARFLADEDDKTCQNNQRCTN